MVNADTCDHRITMGREGSEGSWCQACGVKVLEVHDRPCGECKHFRLYSGARVVGSCAPKLMAVTACMRVTYYVDRIADERAGRPGLCFEAA